MAQTSRKGKKRAPRRERLDGELTVLASVISEFQLDNNAYGWFRPPWRNGRWAAQLAYDVAGQRGIKDRSVTAGIIREIGGVVATAEWDNKTYELAGELHRVLIQPKVDTPMANLYAAAMRCVQVKIARSDGGGEVYNEILKPAFLAIDPDLVAELVLEYRCLDSINTSHHLRRDRNDRQRHAFRIAWERGLYLAAYSIGPAY